MAPSRSSNGTMDICSFLAYLGQGAARTIISGGTACHVTFDQRYVNMSDIKSAANPLFLREEELRQGIELLYYAYRDFTAEPDDMLAKHGFGRAHHRVIYF